uniref:Uncharacterized protein n=1 Tax=Parascaris equorum TaxID=6256 RepID=A0A914RHJ9_PAREQ
VFPDTKLLDVKLCDLRAWVGRREKTPSAFYNEFMRNVWRVHNLYYSGPVFNNTVKVSWIVSARRTISAPNLSTQCANRGLSLPLIFIAQKAIIITTVICCLVVMCQRVR